MQRYNPLEIEPKWQQYWDENGTYVADLQSDRKKYFAMSMFNYPSGAGIHIGHALNYTISDVMARFKRQQGYESYHPVGWDAFGLPAENYAIKTGVSPQKSMGTIIPSYHKQYKAMGWSNDWTKEIATHTPEYYKWTQWIFAEMFKQGLAYQDSRMQWWCDKDKTVLSNEQVIDGKCWRHDGADDPLVEKREIKQWFFKITDYADELLEATDALDWTDTVKLAQKNWIGKSQGAEVDFVVGDAPETKDTLKFTPELTEKVLAGTKTSTVRLESKDLQVGDSVLLQTRKSKDDVVSFGVAKITEITKKLLRDTPSDEYADDEQKLASFKKYYGNEIALDTEFTVYDFELTNTVVTVFTTRPDTIFGATFIVVAPEHPIVTSLATEEQCAAVDSYVKESTKKSELERMETKDKTGVFTGAYAVNPANGEKVPVWVADYVLFGYGTGAIMAVPAHDERDAEFAEKYELPIVHVVDDNDNLVSSGEFDGLNVNDGREKIVDWLTDKGIGESKTTFKLRDWSVSRQRYWGAPIPIINCPTDGPVLDENLPVVLPELDDFAPAGDGRSALARASEWLNVKCPTCGGDAERETDTMDTYICSSWYFLRYLDPKNTEKIFDSEVANKWMAVDFYNGGDHATAHMIYARFVTRFLHKLGLLDNPEPFKRFLFNGKVTASNGEMFSKSKGNGVDPLEIINSGYGADALRTYLMFASPLDLWIRWDANGVPGTYRFLNRVWNLVQEFNGASAGEASDAVLKLVHPAIKKVTGDLEDQKYNTAIASMMKLTNDLYELKAKDSYGDKANWQFALDALVAMVAPFAPHMSEELWHQLGHEDTAQRDSWPQWIDQYLVGDTMTIVVQVNGKLRATLELSNDSSEDDIKAQALAHENVAKFIGDSEPLKVIYIPKKLVNVVVKQ